jgi:FkbM family methyltransferase
MAQNITSVTSKNGKIYWVEEGDTHYIQRLQAGQYQKTNWQFAQTLINDWSHALDIGANNACNSIHYAEKFGFVDCFEPTPLTQQLWTNTVQDNQVKNVKLHRVALGEHSGTTEILIYDKNGGQNHLQHFDKNARARPTNRKTVTVQVLTLDSYNFSGIGFVKIDVEGYEKFVLEGAVNLLKTSRPTIQLEMIPNQCRKFGYKPEEVIESLRRQDYVFISKHQGELYGKVTSNAKYILHDGIELKKQSDFWFQPKERVRNAQKQQFDKLFELC